jgi:RNA recognition motif-containing protein
LRGDNKAKIQEQNVFYKFPKDPKSDDELTYKAIDKKFSEYGPIKSIKIALNADHKMKGFAFVCFENKEDAKKCTKALSSEGVF